jgi:hypothetical protein
LNRIIVSAFLIGGTAHWSIVIIVDVCFSIIYIWCIIVVIIVAGTYSALRRIIVALVIVGIARANLSGPCSYISWGIQRGVSVGSILCLA